MRVGKRNGRARTLLTLAVVAIPWFMRDHLASMMEARSRIAESVQQGVDNASQQARQDEEQRDLSDRLRHIQILVMKIAKDASHDETEGAKDDLQLKVIRGEGTALAKSAEAFDEQLRGMDVAPVALPPPLSAEMTETLKWVGLDPVTTKALTKGDLEKIGAKVGDVAKAVSNFEGSATHPLPDMDTFNPAPDALSVAYDVLYDAAERELQWSTSWANRFRFIAWIATALGALIVGDWKKLLGAAQDEDGVGTQPTQPDRTPDSP